MYFRVRHLYKIIQNEKEEIDRPSISSQFIAKSSETADLCCARFCVNSGEIRNETKGAVDWKSTETGIMGEGQKRILDNVIFYRYSKNN